MRRHEHPSECCSDAGCNSGLRNRYYEGKRLTADAFRVEQDYFLDRRRLINRAMHGWGVVYGYAIKTVDHDDRCRSRALEIGPGLAFDPCGRELLLARHRALEIADPIVLDEKGQRLDPEQPIDFDAQEDAWLLSVHYAEQLLDPVRQHDPCSCERDEHDHVCETVRFSLRRVDRAACCAAHACELKCDCGTGPCCGDDKGKGTVSKREAIVRGGCRCLCDHLASLSFDEKCACLTEIEEPCARVRVDLRHGVPLACVSVDRDACRHWRFAEIDPCGPRRLVKRNDLLFDLIRGCDLTRIRAIGWAPWHRRDTHDKVASKEFRASFGAVDDNHGGHNVTDAYWVEFTKPVRVDTLGVDCFTMTATFEEDEGGWGETLRVPIVEVIPSGGTDPALATHLRLVVDAGWVEDACTGHRSESRFRHDEALIEIEIHRDYILDCNGQAVDANAHGRPPTPTGNGTPGGTYRSNFVVERRVDEPKSASTPAPTPPTQGVPS